MFDLTIVTLIVNMSVSTMILSVIITVLFVITNFTLVTLGITT